jgi:inner membrane transporter RhtA
VLLSLNPAVAALAGFVVLAQGLSVRDVVGIALVVAASAGASATAEPPEPAEAIP